MINNIRFFLIDKHNEYETNQQYIGIKNLFRGVVIKVWFGMTFSQTKYEDCNKVLIREYIRYYEKY